MTKKLSNREKSEIEKLEKSFKKYKVDNLFFHLLFSWGRIFKWFVGECSKGNENEWEMKEGSEERVKKDLYDGGGGRNREEGSMFRIYHRWTVSARVARHN